MMTLFMCPPAGFVCRSDACCQARATMTANVHTRAVPGECYLKAVVRSPPYDGRAGAWLGSGDSRCRRRDPAWCGCRRSRRAETTCRRVDAGEVRGLSRERRAAPWELRYRAHQLWRARNVRAPDAIGAAARGGDDRRRARRGFPGLPGILRPVHDRRPEEDRRPPCGRIITPELARQRSGALLRVLVRRPPADAVAEIRRACDTDAHLGTATTLARGRSAQEIRRSGDRFFRTPTPELVVLCDESRRFRSSDTYC